MAFQQPTRTFLSYLQKNPVIRSQIKAAPNQTLLYAGYFFKPMWKEISDFKRQNLQFSQKEILPDVLARLSAPGTSFVSLLAYVQNVESHVPWKPDGFTLWRALSGIFASNAVGTVSFQIGSGVTVSDKVFAATEVAVLMRNPKVDSTTKDLLDYFQRCIQSRESKINFGFMSA